MVFTWSLPHRLNLSFHPRPPPVERSTNDMAANTKYSPAPQRDSFEETANYTQAPPSYQAEGSGSQGGLYGGVPRSSDDNIPDDFKVIPGKKLNTIVIAADGR